MNQTGISTFALSKAGIFSGLPTNALAALRSQMQVRIAPAGTVLFSEGEAGINAFIIHRGTIKILKKQLGSPVEVARRGPGEIVGEMALIDAAPRSATVVCHTDCELYVLSQEGFYEVLAAHPQIAARIVRTLTERMREAENSLLHRLEAKKNALEASLRLRESILAASPYAMIVTDSATRLQFANSAAKRLFGAPQHRGLWQCVNMPDFSIRLAAVHAAKHGQKWQDEVEIFSADHETLHFCVTMVPVADTGEGHAGCLWVFEDLTEIRELKRQMRERLNPQAAIISEISTRLNGGLVFFTEFSASLKRYLSESQSAQVNSCLNEIRTSLAQLNALTDDLS